MKTYTYNEALEEMKATVQVISAGYGTWKVKASLGVRSTGEYVEDSFTTHDEEWKTGIFDGETYNSYANSEEARAMCQDEGEDYDSWYERAVSDSANDDNYEPDDSRDERASRRILDSWVDDHEWPDNIVVTSDGGRIFVLDEEESTFAESEPRYLAMLLSGSDKTFTESFSRRDDE